MTLPPTAPPGDEPPPPVRRGKRKASPAPAQEVVKPYIEFEPPGMAIKPPWALGFLTLFSEAHEWQQLLRRAEPEAQLKAEEPGRSSTVDPVTEACWQMDAAVDRLIPAMMEGGNAQAAEALIKTASHMTLVLQMMYNLRPELFHHWAATTSHIPVLASLKPSWLPLARKNLVALKVGSRKAAAEFKSLAYDERHVCRAWARRAVETMDRNRVLTAQAGVIQLFLEAGNRPELRLGEVPGWVEAAWELPPFSKATAKAWGLLARRMLREEVPGFEDRAEFQGLVANIRRYRLGSREGKMGRGTIRNTLLDRIAEAVQTIAK